jgi:hypothetical protein
MPPRITEKSCRPRVSDRTMVGNSATRLACEFQKTEWRRHDSDMKPQRGRSIDGPSLRGLWGRSATGQNGQAAAHKEVSAVWSEGWMSENISGVPAGRSVFHLTSPFIGLTENYCLSAAPALPNFRSPAARPTHPASTQLHLHASTAFTQLSSTPDQNAHSNAQYYYLVNSDVSFQSALSPNPLWV